MDTSKQQTVEDTGDDVSFADLFIESAKQGAVQKGGYIPQHFIDEFYRQVE
jgi:hypothetical protein